MITVKEALTKHFHFLQEVIQIFFSFKILLQIQLKQKLPRDKNAVTYFIHFCSFHKNELQLLIGN